MARISYDARNMVWILDILYFIGLLLAAPFLMIKSWRTGKYRTDWPGRLGWLSTEAQGVIAAAGQSPRLLIHCVSVGELLSTRTLVAELLQNDERLLIVISTTTDTGMARALALYPPVTGKRVVAVRYPLDFSFAVRRFLNAVKPAGIALVELETWPNFLTLAAQRHISVQIINGRMTERSFRRYRLVRPLMKKMFRSIVRIGVQTREIADRFAALGADPHRLEVIPTMKYDSADFTDSIPGSAELAAALGLLPEHRLLVAGSTGPGEEKVLLAAYQALRDRWPNLRMAIAPRKPEVIPQVIAAITGAGLEPVLRTDRPDGSTASPILHRQVLVLDTMGELKKLYSVAFAVFSGRSLVNLGGSDMIEAAALSKPCCFGPYTFNFQDIVALLTASSGGVEVKNAADLEAILGFWLANPDAASAVGQKARACLESQRGSSRVYAHSLLENIFRISATSR
jgi:3-deoxy-D-manno-octulosonic-acid transferase